MFKKILRWLGTFFSLVFLTLGTLLSFSVAWMFHTWTNLSMEELVFHLTAPLEGTNEDMVLQYFQFCVTPTLLILFAGLIIFAAWRKRKKYYIFMGIAPAFAVLIAGISLFHAWDKLNISDYLASRNSNSDFIEQHYVNPEDTTLTFPETRRNLIYIYLESMEVTYSDQADGGAFDTDIIPELTELSKENENFSGTDTKLNGGYAMPGATWTMGAMFAQTSGLPLNLSIDGNNMDTQSSFLPGLTTLGDILEDNGYSRTLLIGSDATFGGRALYFTDHGNYDIEDYNYAIDQGLIPSDYHVWWGYEDQKLFQFAQDKLLELSAQEEPFDLTMLTVDTHFEDGYVCDLCPDLYDDQYANVMACSSRQVADFVHWIQQQDFYENTTIIISGDHPTMDSDFCDSVPSDYSRKVYTAVINAAVEPQTDQKREFSTFDMFPTTLAAIGVQIDGDRLGLGTNLFSSMPTLTEQLGYEKEASEVKNRSKFIDNLANIDENSEELMKREERIPSAGVWIDDYDPANSIFQVHIEQLLGVNEDVSSIGVNVWTEDDQSDMQWFDAYGPDEDGNYYADIDVSAFGYKTGEYHFQAYLTYTSGEEFRLDDELVKTLE